MLKPDLVHLVSAGYTAFLQTPPYTRFGYNSRVFYQGVSFELERGNKAIARLCPVTTPRRVAVHDLNRLFAALPRLNEDAESFVQDLDAIRKAALPEQDPWA